MHSAPRIDKHVVSSTMTDPQLYRSTVLADDAMDHVRELKSWQGKDIVVTGGITLMHELIALCLVDEYRAVRLPSRGRPRNARQVYD